MSYLKSFERLEKLHKVDLGFYVLGLHSFMESYIKDVTGQSSDYFLDSLFSYNSYLSRKSKPELHRNFISKLKVDHINTNKVRHDFSQIFSTDAESSTHNFITFLKKSEIDPIDYNGLRTILDSWDYRINTGESEAKKLQLELLKAKEKITKLEVEVGDSRNISNQLELLEKEKAVLDHKLKSKNESLDVLKEDKIVLESKIQELSGSTENTKALEDYIHYLSRFSLYTRTRADYEKSVLKLSVPQKEAINRITLKKDFLIKGSAGTGKSLVLIKALINAKKINFIGEDISTGRIVLLTYSKTLKKYNSYMADILENHIDDRDINTVDSFLLDKFKTIFPDYSLDPYYKVDIPLGDLVKLNEKELLVEIEDFLLAGNVTESEYVKTDGIIRSGMKIKGLKVAEREQVWSCFIKYIHELEDKKTVTFPYLRYKLLNYLLEHPGDKNIRDVQYMFVDEVQDMTPASLAALKELTIGIIVMAGDNNQKIFASTSPYKRAGINLHGSTFTLNENFRNTNQILNFANSFLKQHNDKIDLEVIDSYRDGPLPEVNVIKGSITKAITDQLRIYIDDLGYEKHNIAIIVNSLRDATTKKLLKALESENISYVDTSEANFDFSQENAVRITTLHSCKGLDFPVVLLSIPYIKEPKDYDSETNDEILRNLLYVAFTRAMDNLNIFIKDKPKGILKDIVDCYEEIKGRFI